MDDKARGVSFASKRIQAGRNAEAHVAEILYSKVKEIINASRTFISANGITREVELTTIAKNITLTAAKQIEDYLSAYANASYRNLGIESDNLDSFLKGNIFGKTFAQRNTTYLGHFASDIVRMIKAGSMLGYNNDKILSAIRTGYKEPYLSSIITKAAKKDINIKIPSYGKGIFKSAYRNIIRNVRHTIALAWGQAEQEYGKQKGAIGFNVFRGSSFPCPICDDECSYTHKIGESYPPYHYNCVCYIKFIFPENNK